MSAEHELVWRDQQIRTVANLTDALAGIVLRGNPDEAALFRERFKDITGEYGDVTIGYCLGFLPAKRMIAGLSLFRIRHPYFGYAEQAVNNDNAAQREQLGGDVALASAFTRNVVP